MMPSSRVMGGDATAAISDFLPLDFWVLLLLGVAFGFLLVDLVEIVDFVCGVLPRGVGVFAMVNRYDFLKQRTIMEERKVFKA